MIAVLITVPLSTAQNTVVATLTASDGDTDVNAQLRRDITNKHIMAYVSGLGFGILSGAFSTVNVLADMVGPGTIGIYGDSKYFFVATAFLTLSFILLHTFWGVIFFNGLDKKQYYMVALVVGSHMLLSCLTLLNQRTSSRDSPLYLASILPAYVMTVIMGVLAYYIAGGSLANVRSCFPCGNARKYEID